MKNFNQLTDLLNSVLRTYTDAVKVVITSTDSAITIRPANDGTSLYVLDQLVDFARLFEVNLIVNCDELGVYAKLV